MYPMTMKSRRDRVPEQQEHQHEKRRAGQGRPRAEQTGAHEAGRLRATGKAGDDLVAATAAEDLTLDLVVDVPDRLPASAADQEGGGRREVGVVELKRLVGRRRARPRRIVGRHRMSLSSQGRYARYIKTPPPPTPPSQAGE